MGSLSLYISGLAICHFVQNDQSWKLFCPKAEKHAFKIVVKKFISLEDSEIVKISKYKVPIGSNIVIKTSGTSLNTSGILPEIINLSELIGTQTTPLDPDRDIKSDNNLFAAHINLQGFKLTPAYFKVLLPDFDINLIHNEYNTYKVIEANSSAGDEIKVKNSLKSEKISLNQGEETTIDLGRGVIEKLQHDEDTEYEILIYNNCNEEPDCGQESDFHHYYDILVPNRVKQVTLDPVISPTMGDRAGCDVVILP